uniref:Replication-associated protein n=1 Tax=Cressdnaviricota sp. TaxID=2748378 RepID=A0A8F3IKL1_9VIRU|nr:MAG: replication-associated protein [Cressdnaviricota sp.]
MDQASPVASEKRKKYKDWCFTSYSDVEPQFLESTQAYLVFGRETCPNTGRQHWQGFVSYKNRQYFSHLKKDFPGAHFTRARGSAQENYDYCSKDGNFREFGTRPVTGRGGGAFAHVLQQAERGSIASIKDTYPGIYLRYKKTLESLRVIDAAELGESCGIWLYGPPRSGKDFGCISHFKDSLYSKSLNKWWDGYKGEKHVMISDFDKSHAAWMGYYLKIWSDRYPFMAEIKGGTMKIRPKTIIVTSNYRIDDLFEGQILSAIAARFHKLDYDPMTDNVSVTKRPVFQPSDRFLRALEDVAPLSEEVQSPPAETSSRSPSPSTSSTAKKKRCELP